MRIALTCNIKKEEEKPEDKPPDFDSEFDKPQTIKAIVAALESKGHSISVVDVNKEDIIEYFQKNRPDIVFNIAEGNRSLLRESEVPAVLDYFNLPYTCSNTLVLSIALNKALTKKILQAENIPTPDFQVFKNTHTSLNSNLKFPLIVKPNREGSAKGIYINSVVTSISELYSRVEEIINRYHQEALVEEFIEGKELTVGILHNGRTMVLPILEIDFTNCNKSGEYFYSWRMKEYQGNEKLGLAPEFFCPARLDQETTQKVKDVAVRTHIALGCMDISRVDIRLSTDNVPYVLEINPLPGLDPQDSNFPIMSKALGLKYEDLIEMILLGACERQKHLLAEF